MAANVSSPSEGDPHEYFARAADRWDEIRSAYFTETMRDAAIAKAALPPDALVADIGTGTGFVAAAERNLSAFGNVTLSCAEGQDIPLPDASLDGVFGNMYLRHAPDPQTAIREMVRLLRPEGVLCIIDLDIHTNNWFHEEMADIWLGFDRDDIRNWYSRAGLTAIDVDCAAGTCDCDSPAGDHLSLCVFVAIGKKLDG